MAVASKRLQRKPDGPLRTVIPRGPQFFSGAEKFNK